MLDLDLDQQLRDEFRSAAAGAEPSARLDGLVRQRIVRRQWQRRLTVGGGAALTLALVVAGGAALSGGDGEDSVVMAPMGDDGEGASTSPGDSSVSYLVPNDVPDDMELVHASGGDQPDLSAGSATQVSEWDTTQRLLRMTAPAEVVDVESSALIDFDSLGGTATTVNGHAGVALPVLPNFRPVRQPRESLLSFPDSDL